jgi:mannose-6-phosphate isomerase-like protein (cupin superfamily)
MAKNAQDFEQRPWGTFEVLAEFNLKQAEENLPGTDVIIKKLFLNPGHRLSYQSHEKRMETWIIIQGSASVIINDNETPVQRGSVVKIKLGDKHRLINNAKIPLIWIEIAEGYFDEHDNTRYQDDYGRV